MDYARIRGKKKISKRTQRAFNDGSVWNRWLANFKNEDVAVMSLVRLLNYRIKVQRGSKFVNQFYMTKERILYIMEMKKYLEYFYPEAIANRTCPLCEGRGCATCKEGKIYHRLLYNKVFKIGDRRFSFHCFIRPVDSLKIREKPLTPLIIPIESDTIAVPTFFDGLELLKFWLRKEYKRNSSANHHFIEHTRKTIGNNRFDMMMLPKVSS